MEELTPFLLTSPFFRYIVYKCLWRAGNRLGILYIYYRIKPDGRIFDECVNTPSFATHVFKLANENRQTHNRCRCMDRVYYCISTTIIVPPSHDRNNMGSDIDENNKQDMRSSVITSTPWGNLIRHFGIEIHPNTVKLNTDNECYTHAHGVLLCWVRRNIIQNN